MAAKVGVIAMCPIARASQRALENIDVVAGGLFIGPWIGKKYVTPHEAITFMERFDKVKSVSPFEFELTEEYVGILSSLRD